MGLLSRCWETSLYRCPECNNDKIRYKDINQILMMPLSAKDYKIDLICTNCNYEWKQIAK